MKRSNAVAIAVERQTGCKGPSPGPSGAAPKLPSLASGEKTPHTLPSGERVEFPAGMRQETALRRVEPGNRLLDIGCGYGAVAGALHDRFEEVYGVDLDPEPLRIAHERGVVVCTADLDAALPFDDASFDAVLCLEVVEHVADPRLLLREAARVLSAGGRIYLSTPNIRFLGYVRRLLLEGRFPLTSNVPGEWQGGHRSFLTFADVAALLEGAGFSEVRHEGLGHSLRHVSREFFAVGIFTSATRTSAPLPAPPPVEPERRAW